MSTVLRVAVLAALPRLMMNDTAPTPGSRWNQGLGVLSVRLAWLRYCANRSDTPLVVKNSFARCGAVRHVAASPTRTSHHAGT